MRDPLVHKVKAFLAPRWMLGGPLLLGYSGGPDSKALLYILLQCRMEVNFELCLVHVDHGWREESRAEAELIAQEAEQLKLRLFSCRLEAGKPERNAEALARQLRFEFFEKIYSQVGAQGLLLAHQADDQAETVLKRLLEGAHPMHWTGIEAEGKVGDLQILRPLLGVSKRELVSWLAERGRKGFEDSSNEDLRFLRGRMRTQIFPGLSEQFGKEVLWNLCKAGDASAEIHAYLAKRCEPYLAKLELVEDGVQWDLSMVEEPLELKWLLKMWAKKEKIHVSHELLQTLVDGLLRQRVNQRFPVKSGLICLDRGILFYVNYFINNETN